ncbi:MAG: hypothetical protein N3E51_02365 [Candidatus Micrarchaeota archaeon]|nr:hypothetical protein [Candidatus Micrarchaeota archaeon]
MRNCLFILALLALLPASFPSFSINPYLYASESSAKVDAITFQHGEQTARLYKIDGQEALLTLEDQLVEKKEDISAIMTEYYRREYYPSAEELAEIKAQADSFNRSRNSMTQYGPAEKTCRAGGTFLDYKPCNDLHSCTATASLVCYVTGAEGCVVDVLATYILDYKQGIDALDAAYSKFDSAYKSFSPQSLSYALDQMDAAFSEMKAAADRVAQNKLRFPERGASACRDCLGVCPEPKFDYAAISLGKEKVAKLKAKAAPYATLQQTIDRLAISTQERIKYREGEEKALVFAPKFRASREKFGGLKSQAIEAKALVSDTDFVSAANSFLDKEQQLEQKLELRDFAGFDALLSSYEAAGRNLQAMINNSTAAYRVAAEAQDEANDRIIEASWQVNRLSEASVSSYNSLATRKSAVDSSFKPPLSSAQYAELAKKYSQLAEDAEAYIQASGSVQSSIFTLGNRFGKASVDGAMALASSMMPVSFKTRQMMAKYAPPLLLAVVDLAILIVVLAVSAGLFYYTHGFFRSRLFISGWAISLIGLIVLMLIGSVGFYSIVLSTERFTSFSDFMETVKAADKVAVIVEEPSTNPSAAAAMRQCAQQIEAQMKARGKQTLKYYLSGGSCTVITPRLGANNTTAYDTRQSAGVSCLDSMPDIPVFDLQYSDENKAPVFTTVGAKQAIFKNTEAVYARKPQCTPADVLG